MGELSKILKVPFSTATELVDGLVQNGIAHRLDDPEDRRVVMVVITEAGRQAIEMINGYIWQRIVRRLEPFTKEEQDQMIYWVTQFLMTIANPEITAEGQTLPMTQFVSISTNSKNPNLRQG